MVCKGSLHLPSGVGLLPVRAKAYIQVTPKFIEKKTINKSFLAFGGIMNLIVQVGMRKSLIFSTQIQFSLKKYKNNG